MCVDIQNFVCVCVCVCWPTVYYFPLLLPLSFLLSSFLPPSFLILLPSPSLPPASFPSSPSLPPSIPPSPSLDPSFLPSPPPQLSGRYHSIHWSYKTYSTIRPSLNSRRLRKSHSPCWVSPSFFQSLSFFFTIYMYLRQITHLYIQ